MGEALNYERSEDKNKLFDFSDASFATGYGRKSFNGGCIVHCKTAVMWKAKRQRTVAHSAAQSETIALTTTERLLTWGKNLIEEIGLIRINLPMIIFMDNDASRTSGSGESNRETTRDLDVKHYAITEKVLKGDIKLLRIDTASNTADVLTKALPKTAHQLHTIGLGLVNFSAKGEV